MRIQLVILYSVFTLMVNGCKFSSTNSNNQGNEIIPTARKPPFISTTKTTTTTTMFVKRKPVANTAMPRFGPKHSTTVKSPPTDVVVVNCSSHNECSEQYVEYYFYYDNNDNLDPWSGCVYSSVGKAAVECYNSLEKRAAICSKDPSTSCRIVDERPCLDSQTCTGEWSTWSKYTYNCTNSCLGGTKSRTRDCIKDGPLAPGLCLGKYGEENVSIQTDLKNCSLADCIEGKAFVTPHTPTHTTDITSYLWYGGAGIVAIIFIFLTIAGGRAIHKRRSRLKTNGRSRPSVFIVNTEANQHHNAPSRAPSGSILEIIPYATFTIVTQPNSALENNHAFQSSFYENIEQPEIVLPVEQPVVLSSTDAVQPALKTPPTLPKNKPQKMLKERRIKLNNRNQKDLDKHGHDNITFVEGFTEDDDVTKEAYTSMNSFVSHKSVNSIKALPCFLRIQHEAKSHRYKSHHATTSRATTFMSYSPNKSTSSFKRRPTVGTAARAIEKRSNQLSCKKIAKIVQGFDQKEAHSKRSNSEASTSRQTTITNKLIKHFSEKQKSVGNSNSSTSTQNRVLATDQDDYLVPIKSGNDKYVNFDSHYEDIDSSETKMSQALSNSDAYDYITMAGVRATGSYQ